MASTTTTLNTIVVDLDAPVVEARVSLTASRLNDILRLIVAQGNAHEAAIAELRAKLDAATERGDRLAAVMERLRPDTDRVGQTEEALRTLKAQLQAATDDAAARAESAARAAKARQEESDAALQALSDRQLRDSMTQREGLSTAQALAMDAKRRLDALVIPDIAPLKSALDSHNSWRASSSVTLDRHTDFIALFNPDFERLRRLHVPRSDGVRRTDEHVEYALTLPPLLALADATAAARDGVRAWAESRLGDVSLRLADKLDKSDIASFANEVRDQQRELRHALEFTDRRLKDAEGVSARVAVVEARAKQLQFAKADAEALELKADTAALRDLASALAETRDDVAAIFERIAVGGGVGAGGADGGSLSAPAGGRRLSSLGVPGGGSPVRAGSVALAPGDDAASVRRRLSEAEAAIASLDRRKAERLELTRLRDYVEAFETATNAAIHNSSGYGGGSSNNAAMAAHVARKASAFFSSSQMSPSQPSRPATGDSASRRSVAAVRHGSVAAGLAASVGGQSPAAEGAAGSGDASGDDAAASSGLRSRPNSGRIGGAGLPRGSTGGGGGGSAAAGGVLPLRDYVSISGKPSAAAGGASAANAAVSDPRGGGFVAPEGTIEGTSFVSGGFAIGSAAAVGNGVFGGGGPPTGAPFASLVAGAPGGSGLAPGQPVRQVLGRSVATVRDASGAATSAALGHPHATYQLSAIPGAAVGGVTSGGASPLAAVGAGGRGGRGASPARVGSAGKSPNTAALVAPVGPAPAEAAAVGTDGAAGAPMAPAAEGTAAALAATSAVAGTPTAVPGSAAPDTAAGSAAGTPTAPPTSGFVEAVAA